MNTEIKFNHEAESLPKALGLNSADDFATQLSNVFKEFMEDESDSRSVLAELLHNKVEYAIILLLATERLEELAKKSAMPKALRGLMEFLESAIKDKDDEDEEETKGTDKSE